MPPWSAGLLEAERTNWYDEDQLRVRRQRAQAASALPGFQQRREWASQSKPPLSQLPDYFSRFEAAALANGVRRTTNVAYLGGGRNRHRE